ncbi:hypothetical protein MOUN0_K01728 [Monosporozyma unispora]|nr:hypothetical protein C6P44_004168 [Kazachstania unispora]
MVDDTNYITPHEAALAVVATSMKKARLHISTLVINSIMGGLLFCSGSMLFVMIHSNSPEAQANNPGMLDILGGISYGIGLFYVVVMGVDLYNSNILFFSVGVLRRAVTIWDLLISWFVSLMGNIAGALFMSYVLVHLSTISKSKLVVEASIQIGEAKAHPNFIQVFLKGIGGNFYVCLAIYLQLMAKPLHVKLLMLILPVFTFVTIGFSHTIADMGLMFTAMLNGAHVTVAQYIWKVLIPTALGNAVGGFAFALILPFYLHLEVVEYDRKKLALPKYEARDEQPELNMDSRVVRISSKEREEFADANDIEEDESITPITSTKTTGYYDNEKTNLTHRPTTTSHTMNSQYHTDSMSNLSASLYSNNEDMETEMPHAFIPKTKTHESDRLLRRYTTISKDGKRHIRSPPGVFPVRGMGTPLTKEKTLEDTTNIDDELDSMNNLLPTTSHGSLLSRIHTATTNKSNMIERIKTLEREEQDEYEHGGGYNVEESKPSAQLGKVLSRIMNTKHSKNNHHHNSSDLENGLPRTTQDTFPFNHPERAHSYDTSSLSESLSTGLRETFSNRRKSFREAGISDRIAMMANNTAGVDNYTPSDIIQHDRSPHISRLPSHISRRFSELSTKSQVTSRTEPIFENSSGKLEHFPPISHDNKLEEAVTTFDDPHDESSDDTKSNGSSND